MKRVNCGFPAIMRKTESLKTKYDAVVLLISFHWSLSIPPGYIRKTAFLMFPGCIDRDQLQEMS